MKGSGFYGSRNHHDVFAYDAHTLRSVWVRMGIHDVVHTDPQDKWALPTSSAELNVWTERYGYEKMSAELAAESVVEFATGLRDVMDMEEI